MTGLHHALATALAAILPKLNADPAELAARLARRCTPTLTRPPRAWCIAVRASDIHQYKNAKDGIREPRWV